MTDAEARACRAYRAWLVAQSTKAAQTARAAVVDDRSEVGLLALGASGLAELALAEFDRTVGPLLETE